MRIGEENFQFEDEDNSDAVGDDEERLVQVRMIELMVPPPAPPPRRW